MSATISTADALLRIAEAIERNTQAIEKQTAMQIEDFAAVRYSLAGIARQIEDLSRFVGE